MRDIGKEDTWKRGRGADKRGGNNHDTNYFDVEE